MVLYLNHYLRVIKADELIGQEQKAYFNGELENFKKLING